MKVAIGAVVLAALLNPQVAPAGVAAQPAPSKSTFERLNRMRIRNRRGGARPRLVLLAMAIVGPLSVSLAGCAQDATPIETPTPRSAASSSVAVDPMSRMPDTQWVCGWASGLNTIAWNARGLRDSGQLDEAAYDARVDAVELAWTVYPKNRSEVDGNASEVQSVAQSGAGYFDDAFQAAMQMLNASCVEHDSVMILSTVKSLGG